VIKITSATSNERTCREKRPHSFWSTVKTHYRESFLQKRLYDSYD